jgi:predicted amidohydrolase YtcJ
MIAAPMSRSMAADLVLRGATVITVAATMPFAEAVAVRGGTIVAVGSAGDVEPLVGAGTRVLDLAGRTVVPGFIDSHTHNVHVGEPSISRPRS